MRKILSREQMQQADLATMEYFGLPSCVLMERAALSCLKVISEENMDPTETLVLCGFGNNGGDGFALARLLLQEQAEVTVCFVGDMSKMSVECKRQYDIFMKYKERYEGELLYILKSEDIPKDLIKHKTLIVDALFGIGLSRDLTGIYKELIELANGAKAKRLAIDISSGLNANDGKIMGTSFRADATATFGFAKRGHAFYPGKEYTGNLHVNPIGIEEEGLKVGLDKVEEKTIYFSYEPKDLSDFLPKRIATSNKGTYGKVLTIAGAKNMAGAAVFAASSAYRSGCGLVTVYTEEINREIIQKEVPEAVLATFADEEPNKEDLFAMQGLLDKATVLLVGPGLGLSSHGASRIKYLLQHTNKPLVLDADALNLLAKEDKFTAEDVLTYPSDVIMTPHLVEAARLLHCQVSEIQKDLVGTAKKLSKTYGAVCVLKDAVSVITGPDNRVCLNASGNNGMSTGGSGDVLAGMIAGFLAQGLDAFTAASFGAYVHGLAGDHAALKYSRQAMTAGNISECIGDVFKTI